MNLFVITDTTKEKMFETIALISMHIIGTSAILFILKEIVEKDRRYIKQKDQN